MGALYNTENGAANRSWGSSGTCRSTCHRQLSNRRCCRRQASIAGAADPKNAAAYDRYISPHAPMLPSVTAATGDGDARDGRPTCTTSRTRPMQRLVSDDELQQSSSGVWSQASGQSLSSTAGTTGTKPSSTTPIDLPRSGFLKDHPEFSTATSVTSKPSNAMNTQKPSQRHLPLDLGQIELDFERSASC